MCVCNSVCCTCVSITLLCQGTMTVRHPGATPAAHCGAHLPFPLTHVSAGRPARRARRRHALHHHAHQQHRNPTSLSHHTRASQVGLRAARGAGMHCIITPTSSTEDQPFCEEGAAAVVTQMAGDGYRVVSAMRGEGVEYTLACRAQGTSLFATRAPLPS